jgi:MFS family permease
MLALVQGGSLGRSTLWTVSLIGGAALVALLLHEARVREPMLPLELWRHRIIVTGSLGSCGTGATMMGVSAFLPSYVQGAMGYSAIAGGLVLGAMSVSWAIASIAGGRIMVRTSYRLVAVIGAIALSSGCFMLTLLSPADGPWWAAVASFVMGIGMGFCNTVFIVAIQAAVPWRQRGAATSSSMFMRFVGQSAGAAGCGAVLNATMLRLDPDAPRAVDRLMDTAARAAMPAGQVTHLTDVMAASLHNAYLLALTFSLITLGIATCIPARLSPRHQTTRD